MHVQKFLLQSELTTRRERTTVVYTVLSTLNLKKQINPKKIELQSAVLNKYMRGYTRVKFVTGQFEWPYCELSLIHI